MSNLTPLEIFIGRSYPNMTPVNMSLIHSKTEEEIEAYREKIEWDARTECVEEEE